VVSNSYRKNKVFKCFYSSNQNKNKIRNFINNLDNYTYKFLNILFIRKVLNNLFFIITFTLLYINVEHKNILLFIYIIVFLVYILYLRLLKLKLYKYRNTEQNKFYYKNLSIFILNILLLSSITILINLSDKNDIYPFFGDFKLAPNYLLIIIFSLIPIISYLFFNNFNLLEKVEENIIEQKRNEEFMLKVEKTFKYSMLQKYIETQYIKYFINLFKNIQKIFLLMFVSNLFFSLDQFFIFKWIFLMIIYVYFILLIPMSIIILDIIFLFIINIPYCIIYSIPLSDPIKYTRGGEFDPSKLIQNFGKVDKSIKRVRNLGVWSVCTVICGGYAGYNTWQQYTYPGVETPFDRHNENYVKPFMKKHFNIPADYILEEAGYDKNTLKKKD